MSGPHIVSIQLYTVRHALEADVTGTVRRLAEIGYQQVEPSIPKLMDQPELVAALRTNGLAFPTATARLTDGGLDRDAILAAARELGVTTVIDPMTDERRWATAEGIAGVATDLNAIAAKAAGHGLRLGYHNHAFELESRVGDRSGLEVLADHLDPEVLLEVDTYWAAVGGVAVPALLRTLGGRVRSIHIKDGPITKDNIDQVALGQGKLPIEAIIASGEALEVVVVELDDFAGDIFDAARDSHAYLTRLQAAR
jgi:sugar phosphate isomerase/epimerase